MDEKSQEQQVTELQIIKAKSDAEFALTPIGQQVKQFETLQRMARLYASSSIVPAQYQGDANLGNCVIAIDMATRMGANVLMVMQNLTIVKGNPTWSSKFLVATINASGKFSPLRFEMVGKEGEDNWGCKAYAYEVGDTAHKHPLYGSLITIAMAKKEGWYSKKDKNGNETSKWQSMPEQMLKYRAAAFWQRVYCPEIGMGFLTTEEYRDIDDQSQPDIQDVVAEEIRSKANKEEISIPASQTAPAGQEQSNANPQPKKIVVEPVAEQQGVPAFMQ